jgi:hypothetical protein
VVGVDVTSSEATKLKSGDRVLWEGRASDAGTVQTKSNSIFAGITIKWDNGELASLHPSDMTNITRAT